MRKFLIQEWRESRVFITATLLVAVVSAMLMLLWPSSPTIRVIAIVIVAAYGAMVLLWPDLFSSDKEADKCVKQGRKTNA